jgi:signal transduction histidine kinase
MSLLTQPQDFRADLDRRIMSGHLHRSAWETSPSRLQRRTLWLVFAVLIFAFAAATPFARIPLSGTGPFLPAYAAAVLVVDLVTATLLLSLFTANANLGILVLALGYLFSGLTIVPWALTFPGVFAESGLLGSGDQATAYIAALRRVGFPLFVLAYAANKGAVLRSITTQRALRLSVVAVIVGVTALTGVLIGLEAALPPLMADALRTAELWNYVVVLGTVLHALAVAVLLRVRRRSTLDSWMLLVIATMLLEFLMLAYISSGRFSLGWWAGRGFGLAAASFVLIVLTVETALLHTRLMRSDDLERRGRETRLATMEALSASIAHEVNQPLSSMVTNSDACIRWLQRDPPDVEQARMTLWNIVADGHRAGSIIEGIRTMFRAHPQNRGRLDLNTLILAALRDQEHEARARGTSVVLDLSETLPAITANEVQIRQVVDNLLANAREALDVLDISRKEVRISTARTPEGDAVVSVADSGAELRPEQIAGMFEPFVTTKPEGLGLGLMICRSIVEAHGGRLWAAANPGGGAVFQFRLPAAQMFAAEERPAV